MSTCEHFTRGTRPRTRTAVRCSSCKYYSGRGTGCSKVAPSSRVRDLTTEEEMACSRALFNISSSTGVRVYE